MPVQVPLLKGFFRREGDRITADLEGRSLVQLTTIALFGHAIAALLALSFLSAGT